MTSLAQTPTAFGLPALDRSLARAEPSLRLRLLQTGDGWSLSTPDGRLVFHSLGTRGRRRCLEYARSEGVLVIVA